MDVKYWVSVRGALSLVLISQATTRPPQSTEEERRHWHLSLAGFRFRVYSE
jgi:hypothetical protein